MFLDAIFFLAVFISSCYSQSGETCRTPDNKQGECINIKRCPSITSMLTQTLPVPEDVLDVVRLSQCGVEGTDLRVCCPTKAAILATQPATVTQPPEEGPPDVSNHPNLRLLPLAICEPVTDNIIVRISGTTTSLYEYPWMALLKFKRDGSDEEKFLCGATIINEKYILTVAHCLVNLPSTLKLTGVRVGEYDLSRDPDCLEDETGKLCADPPVDFQIETAIAHPDYSIKTRQNDIGLVRVRGRMNFRSDNVKPICLPVGVNQKRNLDGKRMVVSGWGTTETGTSSNVLLKVAIPVVPLEQCAPVYNQTAVQVTSRQICAGGEAGRDSCSGDAGGPLMSEGEINNGHRFVQYGIISFGPSNCGTRGYPSIYTRVSHYMDWILNNMKP